MDENSMIVALTGQICGTVLLITILSLWFRRRRLDTAPKDREGAQRIEARLSEMQHAIDSIAVEVERISEGQRFTTKLLSERTPAEMSATDGARLSERSGVRR